MNFETARSTSEGVCFDKADNTRRALLLRRGGQHEALYFPSFQMSAESFQSVPTFSHTTRYLPVTSCGVGPGAITRQAYNSPPAARALTNDPVATSISYLFFIRGLPSCYAA
jgi:hypothetical protein